MKDMCCILKSVEDLREGDLVDLQGDKIADPEGENTIYPFEYQTVVEVDQETDECTCVYFENVTVGFPHHYTVRVVA